MKICSPPAAGPSGAPHPLGCRAAPAEQQIEQSFVRPRLRLGKDLVLALGAHHVDGRVHQVAHHGLGVAADVADLGELRRLDLDERRTGEPGQPAGHLGFPDAGRADHDDVVGGDLVADVVGRLGAAPAVSHRDGHRLLGRILPHDVAVQLRDDLAGRHLLEPGRRSVGLVERLRNGVGGHGGKITTRRSGGAEECHPSWVGSASTAKRPMPANSRPRPGR